MPGASTALSKIGALFGSDLNISELDSGEVLHALDGAPGAYASHDGLRLENAYRLRSIARVWANPGAAAGRAGHRRVQSSTY